MENASPSEKQNLGILHDTVTIKHKNFIGQIVNIKGSRNFSFFLLAGEQRDMPITASTFTRI